MQTQEAPVLGAEIEDAIGRQSRHLREYEAAYRSPEVQNWLANLSESDRALAVAAGVHRPQRPSGESGFVIRNPEAQEQAQARAETPATEGRKNGHPQASLRLDLPDDPEEAFLADFEAEAELAGIRVGPTTAGCALRAFRRHAAPPEVRDVTDAKRETAIRIVQLLTQSSSREMALRAECLLVVDGLHPESMAEIGRRYPDAKGKPMSRANVSKICRSLEADLQLGIRRSLKGDDYVEACRKRTQAHHDRKKSDAKAKSKPNTPCPKTQTPKPASSLSTLAATVELSLAA